MDPFDFLGGCVGEIRGLENASVGENIVDPLEVLKGPLEEFDLIVPLRDVGFVREG